MIWHDSPIEICVQVRVQSPNPCPCNNSWNSNGGAQVSDKHAIKRQRVPPMLALGRHVAGYGLKEAKICFQHLQCFLHCQLLKCQVVCESPLRFFKNWSANEINETRASETERPSIIGHWSRANNLTPSVSGWGGAAPHLGSVICPGPSDVIFASSDWDWPGRLRTGLTRAGNN